jgi:hypothetical protein
MRAAARPHTRFTDPRTKARNEPPDVGFVARVLVTEAVFSCGSSRSGTTTVTVTGSATIERR